MRRTLILTVMLLAVLVACGRKKPAPAKTAPAPQPTAPADSHATPTDRTGPDPGVSAAVAQVVDGFKKGPIFKGAIDPSIETRGGVFILDLESGDLLLAADQARSDNGFLGTASWSNDGRQIAFDYSPEQKFATMRVKRVELSKGGLQLTDSGPGVCPGFSPDGRRMVILFNKNSMPGEAQGVFLMDADGSNRERVGIPLYGVTRWSPDTTQILVTAFKDPLFVKLVDVAPGKQAVQHYVQMEEYKLHRFPSFAGDGKTLVSVISSATETLVALLDISRPAKARIVKKLWRQGDGSEVMPVHPVYSEASGRCVFVGWNENGPALYSFKKDQEGPPQRIEPKGYHKDIFGMTLSPDGRYLLFCALRTPEP